MKLLFAITFLVYSLQLAAQVEPSITFDPETGNYIIEYMGEDSLVQEIFEPSTKIDPFVNAKVIKDMDSNYFIYQYEIMNGESSIQRLQDFDLELFSSITEITSPDEFWKTSYYSFVPVFGWYNSKGEGGLAHPLNGIAPDSSEDGFSFMSTGLPAISKVFFSGNTTIHLSFPDEPPGEVSELLKPLDKFPNNTVVRKTIGPKDPPDPLIPLDFLDTLLNYNQRSLQLGWITNQATADKYDSLFATAKTLLEGNHIPWVESTLQTVLEECDEDSSGNITSEAYALLRFNTEYLLENLPEVIPPELNSISPGLTLMPELAANVLYSPEFDFTLTLTGGFFTDSSVIYFNNEIVPTTFVSDSIVTCQIIADYITTTGAYPAWVSNYGSNSDTLFLTAVDSLPEYVTPVVNCVQDNGEGNYTAYLGYINNNSTSVHIPYGEKNMFWPCSFEYLINRGQPNIYLPGEHTNVFTIDFTYSSPCDDFYKWILDRESVDAANSRAPECP
ncbi:MAG TPA: hypothetical protein VI362_05625 [Ignavibacteriaceae bacterium]|nr:hypothetical protein [Ignavibacteriaceae bacterium]